MTDENKQKRALSAAYDRFNELLALLDGAKELLEQREVEGIASALGVIEVAIRLAYESADDVSDAASALLTSPA